MTIEPDEFRIPEYDDGFDSKEAFERFEEDTDETLGDEDDE